MQEGNVTFEALDLSERLRFLMVSYKLSVAQMASAAGVSKSAMEKYLSGPSSPRATSVAALCVNLGINAEWLLFGEADEDLTRVRDFSMSAFMSLIKDMSEAQSQDEPPIDLSDPQQRTLALGLASDRAQQLQSAIADDRIRTRQQRASGLRDVTLGPFPLRTNSSKKP